MATTALEMVNRVLRRHRQDEVSAFSEPLPKSVLDAVNEAAREIVSERNWPWNVRTDGVLTTTPAYTGDDAALTHGVNVFAVQSFSAGTSPLAGDFVTRIVLPSDASFGDTAFRVTEVATSGGGVVGYIETTWPGTTKVSIGNYHTYKLFACEYLLPATVGKIVSVRHEAAPLRVTELDPWVTFDELIPRAHDTMSDSPEFIGVGGMALGTHTGTPGTKKLRMLVWPVPSESLVLHYTYQHRPAAMAVVTDYLDFPDEIIDVVVDLAFAKTQMNMVGNNPTAGAANMRMAMQTAAAKYQNNASDPSRRRRVGACDSVRSTAGRDPTNYRDITGL